MRFEKQRVYTLSKRSVQPLYVLSTGVQLSHNSTAYTSGNPLPSSLAGNMSLSAPLSSSNYCACSDTALHQEVPTVPPTSCLQQTAVVTVSVTAMPIPNHDKLRLAVTVSAVAGSVLLFLVLALLTILLCLRAQHTRRRRAQHRRYGRFGKLSSCVLSTGTQLHCVYVQHMTDKCFFPTGIL